MRAVNGPEKSIKDRDVTLACASVIMAGTKQPFDSGNRQHNKRCRNWTKFSRRMYFINQNNESDNPSLHVCGKTFYPSL